MLISETYRALNAELFARESHYGISGQKWAPAVDSLARKIKAGTVLDYGCGQGTLKTALDKKLAHTLNCASLQSPASLTIAQRICDCGSCELPYSILEYDPAIPNKEAKPRYADLVVCGDVLEHIEPDCLYAVLDDIRSIARLSVFLVVATRPAEKFLADGRNAHLLVEPSSWWLDKIIDRWRVDLFKDFGAGFMCVGKTI